MKTPCVTITSIALAAFVGRVSANCDLNVCPMNSYGQSDFYCMPWSPDNYNCQPKQPRCREMHTDYAVNAPPIDTLYGLTPGDCCAKCWDHPECAVYTFINYRPGPPACLLSRNGVQVQAQKGALMGSF